MFHVKFADIGEGIHEGVLLKNFFEKGDEVSEGDTLFTLETDKVNAEIPSPVSGKLVENRYSAGDQVNVGQVIVIVDDGEPGVRSNMETGEVLEEAAQSDRQDAVEKNEPKMESVEEAGSTADGTVA